MKNSTYPFAAFAIGLAINFSGCYTQLATVDEEPAYSEAPSSATPDSLSEYDTTESDDGDYYSRPHVGYRYYYPSFGYDYAWDYGYDPYGYYRWGCVVAHPWWLDYPRWGWAAYPSWWYYRPRTPLYVYDSPDPWVVRNGSTTTRSSGIRRSGTTERRDYAGGQAMTAGRSASPIGSGSSVRSGGYERGGTATSGGSGGTTVSRTPSRTQTPGVRGSSGGRRTQPSSRSWSLPEFFRRTAGYSAPSSDRGSHAPSPSTAPSYRSEPSGRSAPSYSPPPSAPAPSAPSRDAGSSGRSGGETRSSGSTRSR